MPIPKIIHGTWAGGGPIATTKTLQGITSWLEKTRDTPEYQVWIWWDDAHVFNMHLRKVLARYPQTRANYELSVNTVDPTGIRQTVRPGRDLHNLRILSKGMNADEKLALAKDLIHESWADLEPLRALEKAYPERFKLCNLRSHEFLTGMQFLNMDAYDQELTMRGMFAAAASDILRYEVLYNFGGVYMDVDIDLLSNLGTLDVEADGALVGITPDRKGQPLAQGWTGRDRIATTPKYANKCLYLSNCIIASKRHSPLIDAVRQTIHLAYKLIGWRAPKESFKLDPNRVLEGLWKGKVTRSTLDLTGPNVLRDILWLYFNQTPWAQMPVACISRLRAALERKGPPADPLSFDRIAPVWRDDDPAHVSFWKWVAEHATFPMLHVECATDAADVSDCDRANEQSTKEVKNPEVNFHFAHFPQVARGGLLKGNVKDLHTQHKVKDALPGGLIVGSRITWGAVQWEVAELGEPKGANKDKQSISLKRL